MGFPNAANLESPRSIHYAHDMRRTRPALFCFAWIAGAIWISAGTASAAPARSWHVTAAPGNVLTLSDYVMQPPEDGGDDEVGDSTGVRSRVLEPPVTRTGTDTVPQQRIQRPAWDVVPDSTARKDSMIVTPTTTGSLPAAPGVAKPAGKPRRGVLGIHPAALLLGMIALHVFVVGLATK